MIAVDTNVIVRIIVGDDEDQIARAMALAADQSFYLSFTVLAETEWVLRSRYGFDRLRVVEALLGLADLIAIRFEHDSDARWAIGRYAAGGEFADYLHIAAARTIGRFASFEGKLARRAGPDAPATVEIVP